MSVDRRKIEEHLRVLESSYENSQEYINDLLNEISILEEQNDSLKDELKNITKERDGLEAQVEEFMEKTASV